MVRRHRRPSVITPKAVTPGFELGPYPVAGYALTTELYDCCSLEAWADTNTFYAKKGTGAL